MPGKRIEMDLKLFQQLFFARTDIVALQKKNGDYSGNVQTNSKINDFLIKHLSGELTLGTYCLSGGTSKFICLDIDCKIDLTAAEDIKREISFNLNEINIPHSTEFSGSKGYHIWIFFENPQEASFVREWSRWFLGHKTKYSKKADSLYFTIVRGKRVNVEIYPKQDNTSGIGSLIKVPLGIHKKTGVRSTFEFFYDFAEIETMQEQLRSYIPEVEETVLVEVPSTKGEWAIYRTLKEELQLGEETRMPLARLADLTGYTRQSVSKHINVLKEKGIITAELKGSGDMMIVSRAKYGGKKTKLEKREYFITLNVNSFKNVNSTASSSGGPSWKIRSPFRKDNTPSFVYLTRMGLFKDYATGEIFTKKTVKDRMLNFQAPKTFFSRDMRMLLSVVNE